MIVSRLKPICWSGMWASNRGDMFLDGEGVLVGPKIDHFPVPFWPSRAHRGPAPAQKDHGDYQKKWVMEPQLTFAHRTV